jgi:hypothetical protein
MPHFSGGIEIARPPEDVWWAIGTPERWFDGYVESRSRSADYPGPGRATTISTARAGTRR